MKRFTAALLGLVLAYGSGMALAGPIEEVVRLGAARLQAFQDSNADAYAAAFAGNGVLQSSFSPFRIEGKEAIRAYFGELACDTDVGLGHGASKSMG